MKLGDYSRVVELCNKVSKRAFAPDADASVKHVIVSLGLLPHLSALFC